MSQETQTGAQYQPRGVGWGGRWEGGSTGKGICIPILIHVELWQKTTKFCKAIILQLKNKFKKIKVMIQKKKISVVFSHQLSVWRWVVLSVLLISRSSCLKYDVSETSMLVRIYVVTIAIELLDKWVKKSPWTWFSKDILPPTSLWHPSHSTLSHESPRHSGVERSFSVSDS